MNKKCLGLLTEREDHGFYQLVDFTLQVVDAVEFPLAATLSCEPVFAASPHVVDKLQLFSCKDVLLQQLLEVVPTQIHDPVDREWQLHLRTKEEVVKKVCKWSQRTSATMTSTKSKSVLVMS